MREKIGSRIENTNVVIALFFRNNNIKRKNIIVTLILIIVTVTMSIMSSFFNPSYDNPEKILTAIGGILVIAPLFFVIYVLSSEIPNLGRYPKLPSKNEQKICDRLRGPISLCYANKNDVENYYQHYFGQVPLNKQLENHKETLGSAQVSGGAIKAGAQIKNTTIDKGEVNIHYPNMVRLFLLDAINKGDVLFGIEEDSTDHVVEVQDFKELISKLERYNIILETSQKDMAIKKIKQEAAKRSLVHFRHLNGNALIECEFKIAINGDGMITGVYNHPASDYIDNGKVKITMQFKKDGVMNDVFFRNGEKKTMIVYGQIKGSVDPDNQRWDLELTPIAIF